MDLAEVRTFWELADRDAIPKETVQESERWALVLMVLGGCLNLVALFVRPPGRAKRKKKKGH